MPDIDKIRHYFAELIKGPAVVAFSGGADSVLVLKLTLDAAGGRFPVYAVYADTPWMPHRALSEAREIAQGLKVEFQVIRIDSPDSIGIKLNPPDRCYRCKGAIFSLLKQFAAEHHCTHLLEGTQLDDLTKYRPGLKAIAESGALSPLKELELHKTDVRELLSQLGLAVAKKPAGSCLATRLPYNRELSLDILRRIDEAEERLRQFDLGTIRVRSHGDIARIEVDKDRLIKAAGLSEKIIEELKPLGWKYITLDLQGFRSGSMD